MADSLSTALPRLVKPSALFSKTKPCMASFNTNNQPLSSVAAIYLPFNSCHLSFLAIVFSCLPAWPLLSLERGMWLSGSVRVLFFFLPTKKPGFSIWSAYYTYFEVSYISKYLGEHQRPHFTAEARVQVGATVIQAPSPFLPSRPPFSSGLVSAPQSRRWGIAST